MGGGTVTIEVGKTGGLPECIDREANCSEDLCGNSIYGEFMLKFCTQTCLKCGSQINKIKTINGTENSTDLRLADALRFRRLKQSSVLFSKPTNETIDQKTLNNGTNGLYDSLINMLNPIPAQSINDLIATSLIVSPLPSIIQKTSIFLPTSLTLKPPIVDNTASNLINYRRKRCINRHHK